MSQNGIDFTSGDPSGTVLLDDYLNDFQSDVYSNHSGSARPSYVVAGMLWIDTTTNPWVLKLFNGTDDIVLGNASTSALTFTQSGATEISTDTTPQLGGDLDCNGNQVQWSKGADVASASALAVLTDGNYFDVTGTTTITSINTTGGAGTLIKLHFDAALTLTHHATDLILPGGANITTAAGDEAEFVEYATGDYRCTNYMRASGLPVIAPSSGAIVQVGATQTASSSSSIVFTSGIDSTYKKYIIDIVDAKSSVDGDNFNFTASTDGGSSYLATTNYRYHAESGNSSGSTVSAYDSNGTSALFITNTSDTAGNASGESFSGQIIISNPASATNFKNIKFDSSYQNQAANIVTVSGSGAVQTTTAINAFKIATNNLIASGTFRLFGVI